MKTMFLMTCLLAASGVAEAAGPIVSRTRLQQGRVAAGVASGQLTRSEVVRLEVRQQRLQRTIARDRVDGGGLSPAERAKIDHMQDSLSRDIFRQKHDGQMRR